MARSAGDLKGFRTVCVIPKDAIFLWGFAMTFSIPIDVQLRDIGSLDHVDHGAFVDFQA